MRLEPESRIPSHDGGHDFDFLIGTWSIRNRRLTRPRTGSDSWEEFEGTSVARPIWGGRANMDEFEADAPSGHIRGMTLRLYDSRAGQWRLYWANSANGTLDAPMVGAFADGRGEFFNQDCIEGRAVLVRYLWSDVTANSCRWEQAFSSDGGRTWRVDWTMELTRTPNGS